MPVFAEIVLAVTICTATPGVPPGDRCDSEAPQVWQSSNVVEAAQDWQACQEQKAGQLARPGAKSADCRYSRWGIVSNE